MTKDTAVFAAMKEAMADEVLETFIKEMKELGYTKEDVISVVAARYERETE